MPNTGPERSASARNLGIAHDAVTLGDRGVSAGFGVARWATNTGFGIALACITGPATVLEHAVGSNSVSSGLRGVGGVVGFAHQATRTGQDVAEALTVRSLGAVKTGLKAAGAQEGELLRRMIGDEAAESVIAVDGIVRQVVGPLTQVPIPHLYSAARAWAALQQAPASTCDGAGEVAEIPPHAERWLRFTAATFGAEWRAGLLEGLSSPAAAQGASAQDGSAGEAALSAAGIRGCVEVLAFEQKTREFFAPGYMVAVDHESKTVVLAFRGTASVADVLADLVCKPAALTLGGVEGTAHEGMLTAARRLEGPLGELAAQGLARLRPSAGMPRVVICGFSLGAGVAALLAALWRDSGRFPGVDVRCVAFACPQVLDTRLAAAMANYTTSVILGNDLVPRLSLATATDFRSAMLCLSNPEDYGLDRSLHMDQVAVLVAQGDADRLTEAYLSVRRAACTAPMRLFPPGSLLHLVPGQAPQLVGPSVFDELRISSDMATAHMPRPYLTAIQEATRGAG